MSQIPRPCRSPAGVSQSASFLGASRAFSRGSARPATQPWRERRDRYPQGVASGDRRDDGERYGRERDRDTRDPRHVFMRDLDLPQGAGTRDRDREYWLRGCEARILATVGSFRVVMAGDLRDHDNQQADARRGDLRRLRESSGVGRDRSTPVRDPPATYSKARGRVLPLRRVRSG